mmetsp:Transcript_7670/g.21193  ORF Transcript_7670/g.21193 Transcript_7670/m.21193 type:complete len:131 (-) Transcript_7670:66-458(-)
MAVDEGTLDAGRRAAIEERDAEVTAAIASRNATAAVQAALKNPPLGTKDDSIKAANAAVVMKALGAVKDSEIDGVVDALTPDLHDTLMKYVYRGLGQNQNPASLFKWHAQLVDKSGLGCIVRSMTDRKTV